VEKFEQGPGRCRGFIPGGLPACISYELPYRLRIRVGPALHQFTNRTVAFFQQEITPGFATVLASCDLPGFTIKFLESVKNGLQVLPAQQLCDELHLALAGAIGAHAPGFRDGCPDAVIQRDPSQFGLIQIDQFLGQRFHLQSIATALAFADGQRFLQKFFLAFHLYLNDYFQPVRGY